MAWKETPSKPILLKSTSVMVASGFSMFAIFSDTKFFALSIRSILRRRWKEIELNIRACFMLNEYPCFSFWMYASSTTIYQIWLRVKVRIGALVSSYFRFYIFIKMEQYKAKSKRKWSKIFNIWIVFYLIEIFILIFNIFYLLKLFLIYNKRCLFGPLS